MNFQASIKKINKEINHDLKSLSNWLNANKIALNVSKTEIVTSSPPKIQLNHERKIKLVGKKLYQTDSIKYLGIHLDKYLTCKHQINNVAIKLNKANTNMLSKIKHYVDIKTLKSLYRAIFGFIGLGAKFIIC